MTKLRPAAKAIVPPLLGLLGALGQYLITGHVDQHAILTFGVGLIAGAVTYLVPNSASEVQAAEVALSTEPVSALAPEAPPLVPAPIEAAPAPAPLASPTPPAA